MITGFYTSVLALFMIILIARIIKQRFKHEVSLGDGNVKELNQAVRAHGNFIEMVPMALLLLFFLEQQGLPNNILHGFGITLFVARFMHFYGLSFVEGASRGRFIGTLATMALILAGSIANIILYFA